MAQTNTQILSSTTDILQYITNTLAGNVIYKVDRKIADYETLATLYMKGLIGRINKDAKKLTKEKYDELMQKSYLFQALMSLTEHPENLSFSVYKNNYPSIFIEKNRLGDYGRFFPDDFAELYKAMNN